MYNSKEIIRRKLINQRLRLTKEQVGSCEQHIYKELISNPIIINAKTIGAYHAIKNELSLEKFIKWANANKKEIYIPQKRSNKEYSFSINQLDVILVPCVGLDIDGNRIGYGKGIFDRLLSDIKAITIGVVYDFQIINSVPTEDHDIQLNHVIAIPLPHTYF